MLKKLILIIFSVFFMACSNVMTVKETSAKNEVIRQAISTPEKDVILLGDNYDYLFTGEEAKKLLTLIDFLKIEGLDGNINYIKKSLTVDENGIVKLSVNTEFEIYKKNENDINDKKFEREQENFIYNLKKKLDEKNIKYKVKENNKSCKFSLPNAISIEGKAAKLENHDKILQETSKQLTKLNIDLIVTHQKQVQKYSSGEMVGGIAGVIFSPILIPVTTIFSIVVLPAVFIYEN